MSTQQTTVATGSGIFGLCVVASAVLFILKAAGVIAVSWWVVVAPLLAWAVLAAISIVLALIVFVVVMIVIAVTDRKKVRR